MVDFEAVTSRTTFDGASAFKAMLRAFNMAEASFPDELSESYYAFAGRTVRFRIVGLDLACQITRPFSHLQASGVSADPDLAIDLWDESRTAIRFPNPLADGNAGWSEVTGTSPDQRFVGQRLPNTLTCLDRFAKHIVGSIAWSDRIFIYERAKPLARPLLEWHNDVKVQIIHAGMVAHSGRGVLFAGKSGSGKSTSSLACLSRGFNFLSEDYLGLEILTDGSLLGHSLYNSVFLESEHLKRFPELKAHVLRGGPAEEKSVVILSDLFPDRLDRVAPITAVLLPRVVGGTEPRIYPAPKSQALLALGPSSLFQIPSRRTSGFEKLAQIVQQVPAYWLDLGGEINRIPHVVKAFMEEMARRELASA
ncbi:MAG: hypothetical protein ACREQ7_08210 [Candidatus Binatia bacterium]